MPTYLTPGVYVEEVPSANKPIEGVSTSIAAFVGLAPGGPINTPMLSLENMSAEMLERERAIPARRVGEPAEIAGTALFLASDLASFYYGQVLSPNGGGNL